MILRALAFVGLVAGAFAQAQFDVASIKPSGPKSIRGSDGGPGSSDPGRYLFHSATLLDLIVTAYRVDTFQVVSKSDLTRDLFDLDVKLPPDTTKVQFREMLASLLSERFRLKTHSETREFPAYAMAVDEAGPRIQVAPRLDEFPALPPDRPGLIRRSTRKGEHLLVQIRAQQQTMATLAEFLHIVDGRNVVDRTGLSDRYDFTLEFSEEIPNLQDSPGPPPALSLFEAIRKQLGLRLIAQKVPFPMVVVDSVDRMPSEN